jgi:ubiquinone/menaquinone biosynthesis C-methylase UbiE
VEPDLDATRRSYDAAAEAYAEKAFHELEHKPLDRLVLNHFARSVDLGEVCEVGCGPGHVARYLVDQGLCVFGLDVAPGMIAVAQRLNPHIRFIEGELGALPLADRSLAGLIAYYAIVNTPFAALPAMFSEMARVLRPGGLLLISFHIGDERKHITELFGVNVCLDFFFFDSNAIVTLLESSGFAIDATLVRAPYAPEVEYQSKRAYIIARRSGA